MGTKLKPGAFDCYANAEPDEPMFILLARDRHAADLVAYWAHTRQLEGTTDRAKIAEALECSEKMRAWRERHERRLAELNAPPRERRPLWRALWAALVSLTGVEA